MLRKANKVLIALPENLTADSVASGLALKLFLQKLQKDVELACSGRTPDNLRFLPASDSIKMSIAGGKSLVVNLNTALKRLDEISYQTTDDRVSIYLKSRGPAFEPSDVSFTVEKFPLDLIVTLDAPSLESLGKLFEDNADLFFETPKINIDHKAANELYGAVNLVEVTATSVGEILAGLLESFEGSLLDEDIATSLLTGIITKTASFQHAQTTPEAFLKASRLIGLGGRQQEIIKHLYRTKSLTLLKLWGRCLARLKTDDAASLAYCVLTAADFEKSGAGTEELLPAFRELLENLSGYRLLVLLAQTGPDLPSVLLAAHVSLPPVKILAALPAGSSQFMSLPQFNLFQAKLSAGSIAEAEKNLLEVLAPLGKSSLGN